MRSSAAARWRRRGLRGAVGGEAPLRELLVELEICLWVLIDVDEFGWNWKDVQGF